MSVAQTVQSFAGIANENEFYGHHYLAEVFKGDIRALIESCLRCDKRIRPLVTTRLNELRVVLRRDKRPDA